MKRRTKIVLTLLLLLVLPITIAALYVVSNIGKIDSKAESLNKYNSYSYYAESSHEFVSPEPLVYYLERTTGGDAGFSRFFTQSPNAPQKEIEKVVLTKKDFSATPSDYALYWLGHSSAILELDGKRVIIDPVLDNAAPIPGMVPRYTAAPITREELPTIDVVLITHDHYDHFEAATMKYLKQTESHFVVPLGVGKRLEGWGVAKERITELAWDEAYTSSGVTITACPMVHYSGRNGMDRNRTLWAGYAIKGAEKNIFWSGDSGYGEHFKTIGEKYGPFDLACVEIDGWNEGWPNTHLFPAEVIEVCKEVNAAMLLPVHWGVFDLALHPWTESIELVWQLATQQELKLLTPLMGEKIVPDSYESRKWWRDFE